MSHISDCVDALSNDSYPQLVPGWPRFEHEREVTAEMDCQSCGHHFTDINRMKGEPEPSDFDSWCPECGSTNVVGRIQDEEELDDRIAEFSWSSCDCCGTNLGGSRYAVTGLPADPSSDSSYVPYETCEECYYLIATGEELE